MPTAEYYARHREKIRQQDKTRYWADPERHRKYQREYCKRHPERVQKYLAKTVDHRRAYHKRRNLELKKETLDHYGGHCQCCGETTLVFLALDHIDNNGATERKRVFNTHLAAGHRFYKYLKDSGFPPGYQTLCHNCNWAKSHGGCPHRAMLNGKRYQA